jgi:uracil-DNA glycosylase
MSDFQTEILGALEEEALQCKKCKLCTTRTRVVFGEGNPHADIMFIGEGPGKQEDLQGRPFVGRAGELLTRIIEKGIGIPRAQVYIANIVKCRPTVDLKFSKDRPPEPDEIESCTPYLLKQIEIIQPSVIVPLGNPSTRFLLNTSTGITKMRGKWGEFEGVPVMPTYHPSYILRNGGDKSPLRKDVWEDIKKVMEKLGMTIPGE